MGFEDSWVLSPETQRSVNDRAVATLRQMKQYRADVIESLESLASEMKQNRAHRERYLAANGIDIEELEQMWRACSALAREIREVLR